jgi:hypothetical protein
VLLTVSHIQERCELLGEKGLRRFAGCTTQSLGARIFSGIRKPFVCVTRTTRPAAKMRSRRHLIVVSASA